MSAHACPTCGQAMPAPRYDSPPLQTVVTHAPEAEALRLAPTVDSRNAPTAWPGSPRWWRDRTGAKPGQCVVCCGELPMNDVDIFGRPRVRTGRMFCTDACRQRGYRIRRKVAPETVGVRG